MAAVLVTPGVEAFGSMVCEERTSTVSVLVEETIFFRLLDLTPVVVVTFAGNCSGSFVSSVIDRPSSAGSRGIGEGGGEGTTGFSFRA